MDYQQYLDEINALNDYIRLAIAIGLTLFSLVLPSMQSFALGGVS